MPPESASVPEGHDAPIPAAAAVPAKNDADTTDDTPADGVQIAATFILPTVFPSLRTPPFHPVGAPPAQTGRSARYCAPNVGDDDASAIVAGACVSPPPPIAE